MTTKTLPPRFPKFLEELQSRLIAGAEAYGDGSFSRPEGELLSELTQEALDLAGWGFVLWERLQRLSERSSAPVYDPNLGAAASVFLELFGNNDMRKHASKTLRIGECWYSIRQTSEHTFHVHRREGKAVALQTSDPWSRKAEVDWKTVKPIDDVNRNEVSRKAEESSRDLPSPIAARLHRESSLVKEVVTELHQATRQYGPFRSGHEGFGVLLEEVDELWDEVKAEKGSLNYPEKVRREAIQVAAMAMRFALDLCTEK